jgi:anthranilate synthase component 1
MDVFILNGSFAPFDKSSFVWRNTVLKRNCYFERRMMKILPTLETVKQYAQTGQYDVVPVYCEILSDFCTPIEALRVLKNVSNHCYLLESAAANEKWGRYTFLGFDPKLVITCSHTQMQIKGALKPGESGLGAGEQRTVTTSNPEAEIRKVLSAYRSPKVEGLPSFTGGMVGYFAYDYLFYSEPTAKRDVEDVEKFNDVDLMLFDKVIAFDNFRQKLILIVNMPLNDVEAGYAQAEKELNELVNLLKTGKKWEIPESRVTSPVTALFDKERYCDMVRKAQKHIYEGDIFQIVLSNCLSMDFEGSLLNAYRYLRTINPSPYMFYLSGTDVEIAGASPETLVKLQDGVLYTFPLAGTRPRGKTDEEDKLLEEQLLADEKELAEHNMLVDLGRNDLGKISKFGTVEVEKLHSIERYSHVMHIGSTVRGEIQDKYDALDAVGAVLPAGTLSGAPKIRACQLIGELEQSKRGIYGGAIGYIDFTGSMDVCISIRIAYKKNGKAFVRSGAGIVADSVPEKEYQECVNKAAAIVDALNNCNL